MDDSYAAPCPILKYCFCKSVKTYNILKNLLKALAKIAFYKILNVLFQIVLLPGYHNPNRLLEIDFLEQNCKKRIKNWGSTISGDRPIYFGKELLKQDSNVEQSCQFKFLFFN